jgi:hypothetical protein
MKYSKATELRSYQASPVERLEHLAVFLSTLPKGNLMFSRWYGQRGGCAVGLAAALCPWFQAQGLRLENIDSLKDCHPVFGKHAEWNAVAKFFALSDEDMKSLFDQSGYGGNMRPDPSIVSRKIQTYLSMQAASSPENSPENLVVA